MCDANAHGLREGDGVAFIDPRRSQVDIVQAVGRAIRRSPDKQVGTIVIPVFIDQNADPDEALSTSAFEPVWGVLKALRAHDAALGACATTCGGGEYRDDATSRSIGGVAVVHDGRGGVVHDEIARGGMLLQIKHQDGDFYTNGLR